MKTGRNIKKASGKAQVKIASKGGESAEKQGDELLGMDEVINMLKTTRPTFYRWLKSGKLKGLKAGRQWRFRREDVDRFMKGQLPQVELGGDIRPFAVELRKRLVDIGGETVVGKREGDGYELADVVNYIILYGYHIKASDIHIGPLYIDNVQKGMLRYRVDGILQQGIDFDIKILPAIVERLKAMACCRLDEKHRPQDGRIIIKINDQTIDIRISFLPAVFGEAVTARLLSREAIQLDIDKLGYSPDVLEKIHRAIASPSGMFVVTGPTGTGKTTTMYACMSRIARPEIKAISIEDPVEYILPWITQVQTSPAHGLTFASALRASHRSDPDAVMVGEIRDHETLQILFQTVLTGHLVLTSLHTEDAASALVRMIDIGAEPFLVADSVNMILAQRIVRRICPDCKRVPLDARKIEMARQMMIRTGSQDNLQGKEFLRGAGCGKCFGTGYRGRIVISEALSMTPEVISAVLRKAPVAEIRAAAIAGGMIPMVADGLRLAAEGKTTVEEILRVLPGQLMGLK